jgi:hypothetical protein
VSGGRAFSPSRLLEVIKKYHIGKARKGSKSQIPLHKDSQSKSDNPSFTAPIRLKRDKDGKYKDSGYITVSDMFRNHILPQSFTGAKIKFK